MNIVLLQAADLGFANAGFTRNEEPRKDVNNLLCVFQPDTENQMGFMLTYGRPAIKAMVQGMRDMGYDTYYSISVVQEPDGLALQVVL